MGEVELMTYKIRETLQYSGAERVQGLMAHKIRETIQYSEDVYYDDEGEEVMRVRIHDDSLYDAGPEEELTEQEREDYL
jgi:hypothetical protein